MTKDTIIPTTIDHTIATQKDSSLSENGTNYPRWNRYSKLWKSFYPDTQQNAGEIGNYIFNLQEYYD